jgi:hypothetical protein
MTRSAGDLTGSGLITVQIFVFRDNPLKYTDPDGRTDTNGLIGEISGYPESGSNAWRGANDQVFTDAVNEYNEKYDLSEGQDAYVTPKMLKAQAMVESGGDRSAFETDPLQVNNPDDWDDAKIDVAGLSPDQTMTPEISASAALEWRRYKGYTHDNRGVETTWRGDWEANRRYNGNNRPSPGGSGRATHSEWYADRVEALSQ